MLAFPNKIMYKYTLFTGSACPARFNLRKESLLWQYLKRKRLSPKRICVVLTWLWEQMRALSARIAVNSFARITCANLVALITKKKFLSKRKKKNNTAGGV